MSKKDLADDLNAKLSEKTVLKTVNFSLCTSCEICNAVCPVNAINMHYKTGQFIPVIDKNKCIHCGLCLKICPGISVERESYHNDDLFRKKIAGKFLETYAVYCKNTETLTNSASGGGITTLASALLKDKKVKGVFVLPFNTFKEKPARLKLARTKKGIVSAAKSKYIPASGYKVIKVLQKEKKPNYLIIGTPCQIKGIKKFIYEKKVNDSNLIFFGLFCDKTLNFNAIKYFEDKYAKQGEKLIKFHFRNKEKDGWPGHPKLFFDSGREIIADRTERMEIKEFFQLERCLYCLDKLNKSADISFGDCYIPGMEFPGRSNLIIRTEKGLKIFNEYKHLFEIEKVDIDSICDSQRILEKKENKYFADYLTGNRENIPGNFIKSLKKRKKKILIGKSYTFKKLKSALFFEKFLQKIKKIGKYLFYGFLFTLGLVTVLPTKKKRANKGNNVIIVGGELFNKGAQAMTFTVADNVKKMNPDLNVYLFSHRDSLRPKKEKEKYCFGINSWGLGTKIKLISPFLFKDRLAENNQTKQIEKIIRNTRYFIDISGYKLYSSSAETNFTNFKIAIAYLLNIMIAKKFSVPFYIFPQSIGPFDYPFLSKLFINPLFYVFLKYPKKICVREKQGFKDLQKYTKKNVELKKDIVLSNSKYNLKNIYCKKPVLVNKKILPNSVGIIPNKKVFERMKREKFFSVYELMIKEILSHGKNIYILRHSVEDLPICTEIWKMFKRDKRVRLISDDLNCIELEDIISQFDFIIASRYHSIVHAYKNSVPTLCIGWAKKYPEIMSHFSQLNYFIDGRQPIKNKKLIKKLKDLLKNHSSEKKTIKQKMKKYSQEFQFKSILNT